MSSTQPAWSDIPAVARAVAAGHYGTLLRIARIAAGLTLAEAGELAGYSASTLSRLENRGRRTWDVHELRHLANVFEIPSSLFGLSRAAGEADSGSLSADADEGGGAMRRRELIAAGTAMVATGAALAPPNPVEAASGMVDTIEDVLLLGRRAAPPIPGNQLAAQLAAARADFRATRYTQLAHRLPRLLAQASAGRDAAPSDQTALAHGRLAQAYSLATQLLVRLYDGMAGATADRALQAAQASGDPLIVAEARRLAATVMRRARHTDCAQRLMLDAAQQLHAATGLADLTQAAMYGQLLAAASYTAAMRDDRDTAWTLLGEAAQAAQRLGSVKSERFSPLELAVYKISVARVLGDYGMAVDYARHVDPALITSPERRARYWEDTALALHGRGRPSAAFRALLAAERNSPQEVRYRPWAQQLTRDLMDGDRRNALPGLREFARRVGAA